MIPLTVNGQLQRVEVEPSTPFLWVLRDTLGLMGTKFGCGVALCGACTVHVDGQAVRSCITPLSRVSGSAITTVEGFSPDSNHPLQRSWVAEEVPHVVSIGPDHGRCCLAGAFPRPTDAEIDATMSDILCRCGTYQRIRSAIKRAAGMSPETTHG